MPFFSENAALNRDVFVGVAVAVGFLLFWLLTQSAQHGKLVWTGVLMLVASPVIVLAVFCGMQKGSARVLIDLPHASWAAWFDIAVLLPAMVVVAAGWGKAHVPLSSFWTSGTWFGSCYLMGLALGVVFHLSGGPSAGEHNCPMSWIHNTTMFPALAGAIICVVVPLLATPEARPFGLFGVACLAAWAIASGLDVWRMGLVGGIEFDPHWTDTLWNWAQMRPEPPS